MLPVAVACIVTSIILFEQFHLLCAPQLHLRSRFSNVKLSQTEESILQIVAEMMRPC